MLKTELKTVNLFVLLLNSQVPRLGREITDALLNYEKDLGPCFWEHVAVVYTRWSNFDIAH